MKQPQYVKLCVFLIMIMFLLPAAGFCASLKIAEPQRFHSYSELPIEVVLHLNGKVNLDTLQIDLNGEDITDLFEVIDGNTMIASIGIDDGLNANAGHQPVGNLISAEIEDSNGKRISQRRLFFTQDLEISKPNFDGTYAGVGQSVWSMFKSEVRIVVEGNDVVFYIFVVGSELELGTGTIDENGNLSFAFEGNHPYGVKHITGKLVGEYMSGEIQLGSETDTWYAWKMEDFELGDFSAFAWETDSSLGWTVTDSEPANGWFAAQAPELYDNESASLEITRKCQEGYIRFARKVESEYNFDFLYFYIDDNLKGTWSGNIGYTQSACGGVPSGWSGYTNTSCDVMSRCTGYTESNCVGYTVSSGTHTFKWVYEKDRSASSGRDSAWIDNVQFPPKPE